MPDFNWEQVKDIFQATLEKTSSAEREKYLNETCGADEELRGEVLDLLSSFEESDDFLDEPPISEVAETIVGRRENLEAGRQIGRYLIERKLGAGGVGDVFLARDTELERFVALKILSAEFSRNPDHLRRFVREARAASALNHPNILTIYESGKIEDVHFIAAEFVEGETLRECLRRKCLSAGETLDVFRQTANALDAAHRAGIVHRDIKPENIMIRPDGLMKVLDFGLAKLVEKDSSESLNVIKTEFKTTPGLVMGTVAYMSPEQARGLPTDERTDVWSLGVCLSETVFGVQPFAGDTTSDQIAAILKSEPEPQNADVPEGLLNIIEKCLEKNREDRYQTIGDFLNDLKNFERDTDFSGADEFSFNQAKILSAKGRPTGKNSFAPTNVSSAEYVVGEIKKHKFFAVAASIFIVFALGLILYFAAFKSFSSTEPISSIAVLPFTGEADDEYLADGLSESLIKKFSEIPQLKVATRSSAFQFKNKTADTNEIARTLGVEAILKGRVVKNNDDLEISVELVKAAENATIWGETFKCKTADAQAVQDEIAQIVIKKLNIEPLVQNFNAPITNNGQAYQLYLNGVFYRRQNGPENVRKAIEYQKQAIALDPNFALAYAELGYDYYIFVNVGAIDSKKGLPPARDAIEKALQLNDSLAEAHDINARLKAAEYDWTGAETAIRRAIELNPNLSTAHTFYSELLAKTKRFDEALSEIRIARSLDPLRINLVNYEAEILFQARRFDEAQATYDGGNPEATNETFALIGRARLSAVKNRYAEAISFLKKSLAKDETIKGLIYLGRIYALGGERQKALDVLKRLKEIESLEKTDFYISPAEIAVFYDALGMRDSALENLERAYDELDYSLPLINIEPEYDQLRDEPRVQALLRRINL